MAISKNRQLAAILFADIVGYTTLMQNDESNAIAILNRFQTVIRTNVASYDGEIIKTYGDGTLLLFSSTVDAVECGQDIQIAFQEGVHVPLRIGIHVGEFVRKGDDIFGHGINLAARIESIGVAGSVLFSRDVAKRIKNHPEFETVSLGAYQFKNVEEPIEVFALTNDGFAVPKRKPSLQQKLIKESPVKQNKWKLIAASIGVLAISLVFLFPWWSSSSLSSSLSSTSPSIAVLPFSDMSANKDQAYFGDGIAEEILNILAQLDNLKVAGRTSSFSFKNKELTIEEIGQQLKVNHVLEGSIRKQGNKIRVTAQLIKVADGFHVWSEKYDRDFEDIFAIQDELAQKIGTTLLEKIAPEQIAQLKSDVPKNSQAYDLFLKANHIHLNRYLPNNQRADFILSEQLFKKAIALDSKYAAAYAGLADLYDTHIELAIDSLELEKYDAQRMAAIQKAYELNPNSAYVNEKMGWVLGNSFSKRRDLDASLTYFLKAHQLNPNSANCLRGMALNYRNRGLTLDALTLFEKAIKLDPLFGISLIGYANTLAQVSRFQESQEVCESILEIQPNNLLALKVLGSNYALTKQKAKALAIYDRIQAIDPTNIANRRIDLRLYAWAKGDKTQMMASPETDPTFDTYHFIYLYLLDADETSIATNYQKMFEKEWANTKHLERSLYLQMLNNPILDGFKQEKWYQELLKVEKKKYEQFYTTYPRAAEIL